MRTTTSAAYSRTISSNLIGLERLEDRRLMAVTLGANVIVNPGAESNTGASSGSTVIVPTGWTATNKPTVIKYGASGFPLSTTPGPTSRGKNFFAGGPGGTATSDFFQTIDVSSLGTNIDASQIKFAPNGYLGGFSSQKDQASVILNFQTSAKTLISQSKIGPVTSVNRANVTELLRKSLDGTVPKTTRFIKVQIHFEALSGGFNDGYVDELSLVLTSTAAPTNAQISGVVFNDANGNKTMDSTEKGIASAVVYLDFNNNGQLDSFELKATTDASGKYSFSVPFGTYVVRQVVPTGKTQTTAASFSMTLIKGQIVTGKNFGDK